MRIIETFSPETNFWEEHIQLAAVDPIKSLYQKDTSKGKIKSSKLMWCIALIWDRNSKFFNLPEEGVDSKINLIFTDFYGDKNYYINNKAEVDNLKLFYIKLQDTTARRALRDIESKIEERAKFLSNTPYTIGEPTERGGWIGNTASIIDKILADSKKVYDLYDAALKLVEKEDLEGEGRTKGGGQISMTDSNEI